MTNQLNYPSIHRFIVDMHTNVMHVIVGRQTAETNTSLFTNYKYKNIKYVFILLRPLLRYRFQAC